MNNNLINSIECNIEYIDKIIQLVFDNNLIEDEASMQYVCDSMLVHIQNTNKYILNTADVPGYDFAATSTYAERFRLMQKWNQMAKELLDKKKKHTIEIDRKFYDLIYMAKYLGKDKMVLMSKEKIIGLGYDMYSQFERYYQTFSYFWGSLDISGGVFDVIENRMGILCERADEFVRLYEMLGDYRSKLVLANTINDWFNFDVKEILSMKENNFRDYYDLDLVRVDDKEVVVDMGAYIGDSALDYIKVYGGVYKKIYCYEMEPGTFEKLQKNLKGYENIDCKCKGVGSKRGFTKIRSNGGGDSAAIIDANGDYEVEIVTLDEDVLEPVTLIKMDIEGAEKDALRGARAHIENEHPKLLICVYHGNTDILDIPKMILEMNPDYKLYLRSNGKQFGPAELVLYAL